MDSEHLTNIEVSNLSSKVTSTIVFDGDGVNEKTGEEDVTKETCCGVAEEQRVVAPAVSNTSTDAVSSETATQQQQNQTQQPEQFSSTTSVVARVEELIQNPHQSSSSVTTTCVPTKAVATPVTSVTANSLTVKTIPPEAVSTTQLKKKKVKRKATTAKPSVSKDSSNTFAKEGTANPASTINYSAILGDMKVATDVVDQTVVGAVHNIQVMLQTYGPLTHAQLKHNLPPLSSEKLQQTLDILVALGILQIVDEEKTAINIAQKNSSHNSAVSDTTNVLNTAELSREASAPELKQSCSAAPRYVFMMNGKPKQPRFDNITVPKEARIIRNKTESNIKEMTERIQILRKELIKSASTRRNSAHSVLREMIKSYPSIHNDPLFSAALENARKLGADI